MSRPAADSHGSTAAIFSIRCALRRRAWDRHDVHRLVREGRARVTVMPRHVSDIFFPADPVTAVYLREQAAQVE